MSELERILTEYASFETKVRKMNAALCGPYCGVCTDICCKPHFCQEAIDIPFLSLLRERFCGHLRYSKAHGWLTRTGCALSVGRPPVCYEFFCDTVMLAQGNGTRKYGFTVLSRLLSHIGRIAPGRGHLVEIMNLEDLLNLRYSRFKKRLFQAETAFETLRSFFEKEVMDDKMIFDLSKIEFLR